MPILLKYTEYFVNGSKLNSVGGGPDGRKKPVRAEIAFRAVQNVSPRLFGSRKLFSKRLYRCRSAPSKPSAFYRFTNISIYITRGRYSDGRKIRYVPMIIKRQLCFRRVGGGNNNAIVILNLSGITMAGSR